MVLDSPLGLERRGVILYEYCKSNYPHYLEDVSIAWIEAGYSLKKEPAGKVIVNDIGAGYIGLKILEERKLLAKKGAKLKNLKMFIEDCNFHMSTEYGEPSDSHRYYLMKSSERYIIFGYDSERHQTSPVFKANLIG